MSKNLRKEREEKRKLPAHRKLSKQEKNYSFVTNSYASGTVK